MTYELGHTSKSLEILVDLKGVRIGKLDFINNMSKESKQVLEFDIMIHNTKDILVHSNI